ncbi:MAG: Si-specific NAD(P)(+) transhydrogenase [Archangiaceae bacterium]|nr:Si-specific NAD(P)(+) transhydrogenase [Archangiaceae bacterium]
MGGHDYDLLVIGSGPAGEKGAAQAAYFGKKVALIEREEVLGGASVNTGTLPSKTLRESALYLSGFRQRGLHGLDLAPARAATVDEFLFREERVIAEERQRIADNLNQHRIVHIWGDARFVDAHTLAVRRPGWPETHVSAEYILIATGSAPFRPPMYPFDHGHVYDSDEIVRVDFIPKTMAVVGGGVIGCEYACLFAALGVKVMLIESRPTLLSFLDGEMSLLLAERMRALGVDLRLGETVEQVTLLARGVALGLKSGGRYEADIVLVAAGREANTSTLDLAKAGLTSGKRGALEVDAHYATQVPHIYAAGDCIGFPALAATSMEQARLAVVNMFHLDYKEQLSPILPYGIYTIPETSMCGETEESLQAKGKPYVVGNARFKDNARGKIIGEDFGKLKLLFSLDEMKLLGVHVLGEGATELVHIGMAAMHQNAGAALFIRMCFNYPTLSETYKYATYDALGNRARARGEVPPKGEAPPSAV